MSLINHPISSFSSCLGFGILGVGSILGFGEISDFQKSINRTDNPLGILTVFTVLTTLDYYSHITGDVDLLHYIDVEYHLFRLDFLLNS